MKTFKFFDKQDKVVEIKNLCKYARVNNLNQPSLWLLAHGIKKAYGGLRCLPDVYDAKQKELKERLEYRKQRDLLYPNMCIVHHLGVIKYRIYKSVNGKQVISKFYREEDKLLALEHGLILSQIFDA